MKTLLIVAAISYGLMYLAPELAAADKITLLVILGLATPVVLALRMFK